MTKYILHGGSTSIKSINNDNFFAEILKGLSGSIKILCVYFARKKNLWNELLEQDKKNFLKNSTNKNLEFTLAIYDKEKFRKQVAVSDVVYIRGGSEDIVYTFFNNIKNLKALFEDKVVAGSSAGAYVFAKYYYRNKNNRVEESTGLLSIKVLCHYNKRKDKLEILKDYGEDLKIYKLDETEYCVIKR